MRIISLDMDECMVFNTYGAYPGTGASCTWTWTPRGCPLHRSGGPCPSRSIRRIIAALDVPYETAVPVHGRAW